MNDLNQLIVSQTNDIIVPENYKSISQELEIWYGKQPPSDKPIEMIDVSSIIGKPILINGISERSGKFTTNFLIIYATIFTAKSKIDFVFTCGGSVVYKKLMSVKEKLPLVGVVTLQVGDRGEYYDIR